MLGWLWDAITGWIKDLLIDGIKGNLTVMFNDVNAKVGTIAGEVSQTPAGWNGDIFNMIKSISDTVIVPIAGMIITFVLVHELVTMVMEKNNMQDIDTFNFFKYFIKAGIAVFVVANTFTIVSGIFDVGHWVVTNSAGVISSHTYIDISSVLASMDAGLRAMSIGELLVLLMETSLLQFCMSIIGICITIIIFGRMIEIYLYCSVAPIPFATFTNKEWGQVGNNYLRGLLALTFQGLLIMVCVGIYAVMVNTLTITTNIHANIWMVAAYTVLLCFTLFKTGSLSKTIFNAH